MFRYVYLWYHLYHQYRRDETVSTSRRTRGTSGKSYAPRSDEARVPYPTRLPESTYDALMAASAATSTSANSLVAEALEHYLRSTEFQRKLSKARSDQEEAIRKLSGG